MRILEKIGVENTNLDGALFNYYISSGQDQVVLGVLEQCEIIVPSTQTVQIRPGEFILHGFRIHLDNPVELSITPPSSQTVRRIIARIKLLPEKAVEFDFYITDGQYQPFQESLFVMNEGTYEAVFGEITVDSTGVQSASRTLRAGLMLQSKVDRLSSPGGDYAYVQDSTQTKLVRISDPEFANTIPIRDEDGNIRVALTPTKATHAVSLSYGDSTWVPKVRTAGTQVYVSTNGTSGSIQTSNTSVTPTDGKTGALIPMRNADGNLLAPAVDKLKEGDYYISEAWVSKKLSELVQGTIFGRDVASGETLYSAIQWFEYGMFVVKGESVTVEYMANDSQRSVTSDFHMFIKYLSTSGVNKIIHIYQTSVLEGYIKSFDGTLDTDLSVSNGSTQYGARVIKMQMKDIST